MYEIEREKTLVQQAQKGNRQAIGKLYDGLFPGVYAYTRLRCPQPQMQKILSLMRS